MKDKAIITVVCIVCATILVMWALYLGYDSVVLASGLGGILYIGGYKHAKWRERRYERNRN